MGTSSYAGMSDNVDRFVCSSRHHGALASVKAAFMVLVAIQSFSARAATTGREDAFIGYSERFSASCRDQLEECKRITHSNGCLTSPYVTRTSCPKSCSVPRCVFLGSLQVCKLCVQVGQCLKASTSMQMVSSGDVIQSLTAHATTAIVANPS